MIDRLGAMPSTVRMRAVAAVCAMVATASIGLAACGSSPAVTTTVRAAPVPIAGAISSASGTWAVVDMGRPSPPLNMFWQLVYRPARSSRWQLETPPGVATNGGIDAAIAASGSLLAGIAPTFDLRFSVVEQTGDAGRSWAYGTLPTALVTAPSSIAEAASLHAIAVEAGTHPEVVASAGRALTSWVPLVSSAALGVLAARQGCRLEALTAVDLLADDTPIVAGACAHGTTAAVFELVAPTAKGATELTVTAPGWHAVGPSDLGGAGPVEVLRLSNEPSGLVALVRTGTGAATALRVATASTSGPGLVSSWQLSAPLRIGSAALRSTSVASGGTDVVVQAHGDDPVIDVLSTGADSWRTLPPLDGVASVAAPGPGGDIDALCDAQSTLIVESIARSGAWHVVQALHVPIQYGSSN